VRVSGTLTYDSVPNSTTNGALNYNAVSQKPVRGVTVQAVSGATVLASTQSSELGGYLLTLPQNTSYAIRVRAELIQSSGAAVWNVAAKDNTSGDALWTVETAAQSSGTADAARSFNLPSGWTGTAYGANRPAAPFAILDTIYASMKLVRVAQPTVTFPPLNVFWSPNNRPAGGNLSIGDIGTSFFTFRETTSGAATTSIRSMYILGAADTDTDEYDSAVIAHEYGHYLQSAFSTNHSLGGPHGSRDKLDKTVAFGEGFGNAWSSMARNDPLYSDSQGPGQSLASFFDVRRAAASPGWYSEDSVQSILYQFFVSSGVAPIWSALTGPMKNSQDALASIFSFAAAVRSTASGAVTGALNGLLSANSISGTDQWGGGETNNGGSAFTLPVYTPLSLGVPARACLDYSNQALNASSANKLGAVKYFRVTLASAGPRTITANFPAGRDIDYEVYQNRVVVAVGSSSAPTSEATQINLSAGEVVIRVLDAVTSSAPSLTNCATLTIN
jgi:hypothetical protein